MNVHCPEGCRSPQRIVKRWKKHDGEFEELCGHCLDRGTITEMVPCGERCETAAEEQRP